MLSKKDQINFEVPTQHLIKVIHPELKRTLDKILDHANNESTLKANGLFDQQKVEEGNEDDQPHELLRQFDLLNESMMSDHNNDSFEVIDQNEEEKHLELEKQQKSLNDNSFLSKIKGY